MRRPAARSGTSFWIGLALAFPSVAATDVDEPPVWAPAVELEQGQSGEGESWVLPLSLMEAPDGKSLCALYGLRSEQPGRYAVYARWSRDGGAAWEERKLLGLCTWVSTGWAQTLVPRIVPIDGELHVIGSWEDPDDPGGQRPQTIRIHALDKDGPRLLAQAKLPPATEAGAAQPAAHWVHRLGVFARAGRWTVWGVRGRDPRGQDRSSDIELQPFAIAWDRKAGRLERFEALGSWKSAEKGWVADTLQVLGSEPGFEVEGFDLKEGGWVTAGPGPAQRRVEDLLTGYREREAPIARLWRWSGRPAARLVTFLEEKHPRSALVEETPAGWKIAAARWEQPSYLWDLASDSERCLLGVLTGFAEGEVTCRLYLLDAAGSVRQEPAFEGIRRETDSPTVALGAGRRAHVLFRCEVGGTQYLLARSQRPPAPKAGGAVPPEAVRGALQDLASVDPSKAAAARARILQAGADALPALKEALARSPELKAQLTELIERILPAWADRE